MWRCKEATFWTQPRSYDGSIMIVCLSCAQEIELLFSQRKVVSKGRQSISPTAQPCADFNGKRWHNGAFFVPLQLLPAIIMSLIDFSEYCPQPLLTSTELLAWKHNVTLKGCPSIPSAESGHVSILLWSIWSRHTQNLMTASLVKLTLFKLIRDFAYLFLELFMQSYLQL